MRVPRGFDRKTFAVVEGWPYVESLLADALSTRKATRVLARRYGSDIPAYVDAPGNVETILATLSDVAMACNQIRDLETGEAVIRFVSAQDVGADRRGRYALSLTFDYLPDDTQNTIALDRLEVAA